MEEHHDQSFDFLNARFLLAAFAIVGTLAFVSGAAFGADGAPCVEEQWSKVAEVMSDIAKGTGK